MVGSGINVDVWAERGKDFCLGLESLWWGRCYGIISGFIPILVVVKKQVTQKLSEGLFE